MTQPRSPATLPIPDSLSSELAIAAQKNAPTVLFLGRGGLEMAERPVGGYIPDFYGACPDARLLLAHAAMRR